MEDHAAEPRSSGLRPPNGPPTFTAIGASDGPQDSFAEALLFLEKSATATLPFVSPNGRVTLEHEYRENLMAVDQSLLDLLQNVDRLSPEERSGIRAMVQVRRDVLAEQIELERLVQRPPKKGHLPFYADEDVLTGYLETLRVLDQILEKLPVRHDS